jgi:hypothetical protein
MRALNTRHLSREIYEDKSMAFLAWDGLLHVHKEIERAFYGRRYSGGLLFSRFRFLFSSLATCSVVVLYIHLASSIRVEIYPLALSDLCRFRCDTLLKMTKKEQRLATKT